MWLRVFIIFVLFLIIANLFFALFHLMKGGAQDTKVVKALTWRISLSIGLFLLLMLGFYSGAIRH